METRSWQRMGLTWLLVAAAAFCSCSKKTDLSRDDIRLSAGDLRSMGSAAAVLCEEFQKGNTTIRFFTSQSGMVRDKIASVEKDLGGEAAEYEQDRQRAVSIGGRMEEIVAAFSDDPPLAGSKAADLRRLSAEARELEKKLEKP